MDRPQLVELVVSCFLFDHDRDYLLPSLERASMSRSNVEKGDVESDDAIS